MLAPFFATRRASWVLVGPPCAFLGCSLVFLTGFLRFQSAPGVTFEDSGTRTSLRNALINAVTTLFHLPALFILPSGAAVCAEHMEYLKQYIKAH